MAPTEGRVARPERWWGCRHGNPLFKELQLELMQMQTNLLSIVKAVCGRLRWRKHRILVVDLERIDVNWLKHRTIKHHSTGTTDHRLRRRLSHELHHVVRMISTDVQLRQRSGKCTRRQSNARTSINPTRHHRNRTERPTKSYHR